MRALFYGLGSDGTVGANKNSIAIIGEHTPSHAQGYFVYDSKKAGSITVSHLRFGPDPIRSTYLITRASFIGCHQFAFLERMDVLAAADRGATFLLNAPYAPEEVWDHLPRKVQQQILDRELRVFVIDAYKVARQAGMGGRINTIMQTCFFAVSGVLPHDAAIAAIKSAIQETYGKRGDAIVQKNFAAVDTTLAHLHEVAIPAAAEQHHRYPRAGALACAGVRARYPRHAHRGLRRFGSDQRAAARRNFSERHLEMGEAQHRAGDSRCGTRTCASNAGSACWSARMR